MQDVVDLVNTASGILSHRQPCFAMLEQLSAAKYAAMELAARPVTEKS